MAIIVENMNMPSTCTMCWISNICQDHIHDLTHIGYEKRLDDCPLREVVHGEWVVCDAPPPTWWYECSICHKAGNVEYNFCPNCGAKMDERREV